MPIGSMNSSRLYNKNSRSQNGLHRHLRGGAITYGGDGVGTSESVVRVFTTEVTSDQILVAET